jgi:hypothetical protein
VRHRRGEGYWEDYWVVKLFNIGRSRAATPFAQLKLLLETEILFRLRAANEELNHYAVEQVGAVNVGEFVKLCAVSVEQRIKDGMQVLRTLRKVSRWVGNETGEPHENIETHRCRRQFPLLKERGAFANPEQERRVAVTLVVVESEDHRVVDVQSMRPPRQVQKLDGDGASLSWYRWVRGNRGV